MTKWEVPKMPKATKLLDFMNVFSPYPLDGANFDSFYVDTSAVRNYELKRLELLCKTLKNPYAKILFSGHMGTGKTTEMYRLKREICDEFEIISIFLKDDLDTYTLTYVDLIFEVMSAVILHFKDKPEVLEHIDEDAINQLYNYWHSEHFREELDIDESELEIDGKVDMSVKHKVSFLGMFTYLAKIAVTGQGVLKTATTTKDSLRLKIEPRIKDLVDAINVMLKEINRVIAPKQLLIFIEDFDKVASNRVNELFVEQRNQILALNVKAVLNIPIYMIYSFNYKAIKDDFDAAFVLSTIRLQDSDKSIIPENVQFLKKFVFKRADESLFDNDALEYMIIKSGGLLRDLFSMIVDASLFALTVDGGHARIEMKDAEAAYEKLRADYKSCIATEGHYHRLVNIYEDPIMKFEDDILMDLLKSNAVIECGGEKYCLVHPALVDYLRQKGDIV